MYVKLCNFQTSKLQVCTYVSYLNVKQFTLNFLQINGTNVNDIPLIYIENFLSFRSRLIPFKSVVSYFFPPSLHVSFPSPYSCTLLSFQSPSMYINRVSHKSACDHVMSPVTINGT
jgi:hypothetical protein